MSTKYKGCSTWDGVMLDTEQMELFLQRINAEQF